MLKRACYLAVTAAIACGSQSILKKEDGRGASGRGGSGGSESSGAAGMADPGGEGGEGGLARGGVGPTGGTTAGGGHAGSGGMAVAGNSTAGAGASGGSAGSGGRLPLPDGCEERSGSVTADTCSLAAFCGPTPNIAQCTRLASGTWQCSCMLEHSERTYEIDGAPGLGACAVAIGLCNEDGLDLGRETCAPTLDEKSADECRLELTCGRPITVTFARDVEAKLVEYGQATCSRPSGGRPFECTCLAPDSPRDYGVLAEGGEQACRPLVDFCMSGSKPSFEGSAECFDISRGADSEYCELNQLCATPMWLTDDVRLAALAERRSSCQSLGALGSSCYCSTPVSVFDFDVAAHPTAETCTLAVANCDDELDIRVTGEPECEPQNQSASSDSCDADLTCVQEASVNSRAVVGHGRLGVRCARVSSGEPWRCSCASHRNTAIFELGAESMDGWDVCGVAPAACLEHMSVFIGPYGDFAPPPDPLGPP